ncbi:hypothetical protein ACYJ1Y_05630 [Natrialbaceae archaeon A-gly3]
MVEPLAIATLALTIVAGVVVYAHWKGRDRPELEGRLRDALSAQLGPGLRTHLEEPITLTSLEVVDHRDGDPVYVPVISVPLGTTDAPGMDLVCEYVVAVLEVVVPPLTDEHVRRYDVRFSFGPNGLIVSGERRRVSVPPELATRVLEDETYRAHDLRRDLEVAEGEAVLWGPCGDGDVTT